MTKISAISKKETKDGKPRWGVMVDGSWVNTINPSIGAVVDTLTKGDMVDIEIEIDGQWKNIKSITPVEDVNKDVHQAQENIKKYVNTGGDDRTTSIVRQALLKSGGSVNIPPFVWEMMLSDVMGESMTPADVVKVVAQRSATFSKLYAQELESYAKGGN